MTFDEWQQKHGPNGGAYDIEMQRAGWDGRQPEIDRLRLALRQVLGNPPSELPMWQDSVWWACLVKEMQAIARDALTPNAPFSGERSESAGTGS